MKLISFRMIVILSVLVIAAAVLPAAGSEIPLSVKSSNPVPKKLIPDVMHELSAVRVTPPIAVGQVIVPDILGTGSDVVATRELK